ncbi:MAG: hypothetical protein EPN64_13085 [Burkholderiaceae bacterium]|nr:MAG: hypothetical protein EPN64_13085 [Burkholderiaceae bacterium]
MTNDAKAQKAARNSRLVAQYKAIDPGLAAIAFNAEGWDRVMAFAKRPAHIRQVENFLEEIDKMGWTDHPDLREKIQATRKILRKTAINQALRDRFGRS